MNTKSKHSIRRARANKYISLFMANLIFLNASIPGVYAIENSLVSITEPLALNEAETIEIESIKEQVSNDFAHKEVSSFEKSKSPTPIPTPAPQAESSGFSIGTTDGMVDKFTGDFNYSIPLLDAEGYPIVLSYNSNVSMLNEASWVGLGWNLNVGAISREMRGIPDEFNGDDIVERIFTQNDGMTVGKKNGGYITAGVGKQGNAASGGVGLSFLKGKYMDSYLGLGKTKDINISGSARYSQQSSGEDGGLFLAASINWGVSYDSKNGIGSSFGLGLKAGNKNESNVSSGVGLSYQRSKSTRYGLVSQSVSLNASFDVYKSVSGTTKKGKAFKGSVENGGGSIAATSTFTYGTSTSVPKVSVSGETNSELFEQDYYVGVNFEAVSLRLGYLNQKYNSTSTITYNNSSAKLINQPAYGYLHSGKRKSYSGSYYPIMDFNRGIENEYSEEMIVLPFSVQTHDVFYVNGSGINGTFRPQRSDYGTYYDASSENMYNNDSQILDGDDVSALAIGITIGSPFPIGLGIAYSSGTMKAEQKSGNWNGGVNLLEFNEVSASSNFDNSAYFRPMGSITPVDMTTWDILNGNTPDYYDINVSGSNIIQENYLKKKGTYTSVIDINGNSQETYSEFLFKPYTADELTNLGAFEGTYSSVDNLGNVESINRINGVARKSNHISSIEVVNPNGIRYEYGIPSYVVSSQEVTFSTGEKFEMDFNGSYSSPTSNGVALSVLPENGIPSNLITYDAGTDNSISNTRGRSHYFDKTITPGYADAFLLTKMVSSDYIDRTNNGTSIDDIGNYYKFNYTRLYSDSDPYGNRFPISGISGTNSPKAFFARGAIGTSWDDMANYTYSETEVWYTHSIETKNLIVEFHLEDREDAYSTNENGFLESSKPKKYLSEIVVYNRNDKVSNQNAVPLQTIKFYYDYSLCQESPGNLNTYNGSGLESGKLTLKEIRTYNGDSKENALSAVSFEYASGSENPKFSYSNVDGWGENKLNTQISQNDIYPYSNQNETEANLTAKSWKLIAIDNPMGGRIEIDYESDSYGYVQNKRAMRLFDVHRMTDIFDFLKIRKNGTWDGIHKAYGDIMESSFITDYLNTTTFIQHLGLLGVLSSEDCSKYLFQKSPISYYNILFGMYDVKKVPNNVIIFKLDNNLYNLTQAEADEKVADLYFRDPNNPTSSGLKELFTKMYVKVKDNVYDLIPSMATISKDQTIDVFGGLFSNALQVGYKSYGAMPKNPLTNEYEYGYVIVDPVHTGKRGNKDSDKMKKGDIAVHPIQLAALEYSRQALSDKVYGADPSSNQDVSAIDESVFHGDDIYKYMIEAGYCNQFNPDLKGKSIVRLNEADYTKFGGGARVKEIRYYDNWNVISNEYNSEYAWVYNYSTLVGRERYSTGVAAFEPMSIIDENPFNEWITYTNIRKKFPDENKFIPGPISYQLFPKPVVGYEKVEVVFKDAENFGKSTTVYHTAKDHPTVTRYTTIDKSAKISKNNLVTGKVREVFGYTQGFVVETNDFHGKLLSSEVTKKNTDNEDVLISKTSYNYYKKGEQVKMANRSGQIGSYNVAIEYDIHADSKYATDQNNFVQVGLDFVLNWTPLVLFTPSFKPIYNQASRERSFYSHALIKHINYSAVLKNVETEYLGSINTATTDVFDKYSGSPIVSNLTDEYNDKLYQVNYPSHWKYKELRELHEINRKLVTITIDADGKFIPSSSSSSDFLSPGDIVSMDGFVLTVAQKWPWTEDGSLFFFYPDGTLYYPNTIGLKNVLIRKSNRDNRLLEGMQSFTSKVNPIDGNSIVCPIDNIYSASAITYRDKLQALCGDYCDNNNAIPINSHYNPYEYGLRGDLVLDKQFDWQSSRSNEEDAHKTRFDGAFKNDNSSEPNFILFYENDATTGQWHPVNSSLHSKNDPLEEYQLWRPLGNVTSYDQYGNALEAKDQIGVHSAMLMGYSATYNSLPVAQAVNAQKIQIAFDGFEDYSINDDDEGRCRIPESHFDYYDAVLDEQSGVSISNTNRHSGLASLQVNPQRTASVRKSITDDNCLPTEINDTLDDGEFFSMNPCACISPFAPTPGRYIIGVWIGGEYESGSVEIVFNGSGLPPVTFLSSGNVIDNWQRLEGEFDIPIGTTSIDIRLKNESINKFVYFDDLRIHPFLAGMQTTVYHPQTFLPIASHDGYNFTTFYNYDENLNLVRIRVETIEGIKTVMESESGGQKSFAE